MPTTLEAPPAAAVEPQSAFIKWFADTGIAWTSAIRPSFAGGTRNFVSSAGFGLRANLFGFAIGEINLVRPLNRPGRGWMFVFALKQGY